MPKNYTRFKTTNWYVVTGAPSSGKTTVLNGLRKMGFLIYPETARFLIDKEIKKGKKIGEIRKNEAEFQEKIFKMKLAREKATSEDKTVFFDRGIPDSLAYYKVAGLNWKKIYKYCNEKRYKKVFFLEKLLYKKDYARTENVHSVKIISNLLKKNYRSLGYKLIIIPVASPSRRVGMILKKIKGDQATHKFKR